jgi:hypothetical protein
MDDDILGLEQPQQGKGGGWLDGLARIIRRAPEQKPPRPSDDHGLLLRTYQAAQETADELQVGLASGLGGWGLGGWGGWGGWAGGWGAGGNQQ